MLWLPKRCRPLYKREARGGVTGAGLPIMNVAEFEDLLDRLGEDMSNWPAPQREAAAALLRTSEQARAVLDESRMLRRALSAPPVRASAGLSDRIMQGIDRSAVQPAVDSAQPSRHAYSGPAFLTWPRSPRFILAVCFVIGMGVGLYPSLVRKELSPIDFPHFLAYAMDISRVAD
jgi:hypothetical protein